MPIYSYVALKRGKEVVKGEITASNLKDARDVVRKMGLVPTKISEYVDSKQKKRQCYFCVVIERKNRFYFNTSNFATIWYSSC